jgi:cyclase
MLRPRIIPCLLVHKRGLVKTVGFRDPKYVGDPINAVRIFNEKECDELVVLDIDATVDKAEPDYATIGHLAAECRMPLCYGGGVSTPEQAKRIISLGVEKVSISSAAARDPNLVLEISRSVGRQSVVVTVDVKKAAFSNRYSVWTHNGTHNTKRDALEFATEVARLGAGEVVFNFIDLDGRMTGYDIAMARRLRQQVNIPMSILGGAGSLDHLQELFEACGVVGAAAGSLFVFKGRYRAVLISYPDPAAKDGVIARAQSV